MSTGAGRYRRGGWRGFLTETDGAATAEYALIIVIIGLGLGVAAWGLAGSVADSLTWAGTRIASFGGSAVVAESDPKQPALPSAKPDPKASARSKDGAN